jgi:hypothetical protein
MFENQGVSQREKNTFSAIFILFMVSITLISLWKTLVKLSKTFVCVCCAKPKPLQLKIVSTALPQQSPATPQPSPPQ